MTPVAIAIHHNINVREICHGRLSKLDKSIPELRS